MEKIPVRANILVHLMRWAGKLPLSFHYKVGKVLSWFLGSVMKYRKDVIITNLARSFPEQKYGWIRDVAKQYYERLGHIAAEAIWFGGCHGKRAHDRLRQQHIYEYANSEVLIDAQKERGVLIVKGHCGNWEVFSGFMSYDYRINLRDYIDIDNFYFAYKPMSSKIADRVFYENRRAPEPNYEGLVKTKDIVFHALDHRDDRPIYCLIADQGPYRGLGAHEVGTFLNQPTTGMVGGFALAAKFDFAVLYAREERLGRGHYRITYEVIEPHAKGCDPGEMMKKFYKLLEEDIRKDPANWLWSHKRWR